MGTKERIEAAEHELKLAKEQLESSDIRSEIVAIMKGMYLHEDRDQYTIDDISDNTATVTIIPDCYLVVDDLPKSGWKVNATHSPRGTECRFIKSDY